MSKRHSPKKKKKYSQPMACSWVEISLRWAMPSALWAWERMKTCLLSVSCSTKHLVSQFLTFSHWLRIETSENWKALNKKNKIKANVGRADRKKGLLSVPGWGRSCLGAGAEAGSVHRFPEKKRPQIIHSKVLTLHLICSFARTWSCCFFCEMLP